MITENDIPKASEHVAPRADVSSSNPVADFLGVKDGDFLVQRSDGSSERGWRVADLTIGPMGERQGVVIWKDIKDEQGGIVDTLQKTVPVDRLHEWQNNPEGEGQSGELTPAEQYTKQRLEKLFAPPRVAGERSETEAVPVEVELDEEYLFGDKDVVATESSESGFGVSNEKKAHRLREEDIQQATHELRGVMKNPVIASIINQYKGSLYRAEDLVGLVRKSADVRQQLGAHIVDLLDRGEGGAMPYRIVRDDWKTPNHAGYEDLAGKVRSREYVAKLVLAMLDGTFDISQSNKDPIDIVHGDGLGQHRTAAQQVLRHLATSVH